jgi:hypothetical protein
MAVKPCTNAAGNERFRIRIDTGPSIDDLPYLILTPESEQSTAVSLSHLFYIQELVKSPILVQLAAASEPMSGTEPVGNKIDGSGNGPREDCGMKEEKNY